MELKQSFQNIQAWIKKNPKKAGAIALVLIVIAYFAIKRGAASSGTASEDDQGASIPTGEIDLSGMGGSAGSMPNVSGGAGDAGGLSGGSSSGGGSVIEPAPAQDFASSYEPGNFTGGGFSGEGVSDYDPTPAYMSAAAPISTGSMIGGSSARGLGTASAGVKAVSAAGVKTAAPAAVKSSPIRAQANAGIKTPVNTSYPPVMTAIKETLKITPAKKIIASAGTGKKGGAVNTKIASAKINPAATKKTTTPAPVTFAWFRTRQGLRLWLPITTGQSLGYTRTV